MGIILMEKDAFFENCQFRIATIHPILHPMFQYRIEVSQLGYPGPLTCPSDGGLLTSESFISGVKEIFGAFALPLEGWRRISEIIDRSSFTGRLCLQNRGIIVTDLAGTI